MTSVSCMNLRYASFLDDSLIGFPYLCYHESLDALLSGVQLQFYQTETYC